MDNWSIYAEKIIATLTPFAHLLVPFAVLVTGWIIALILSGLVRRILGKTDLDNRLVSLLVGEEAGSRIEAERWISRIVFYLMMLFVLVAFFQSTGLTLVTQPLNSVLSQILGYLPNLLSAAMLLTLAWVLASVVRIAVSRVLKAAKVDERLGEKSGVDIVSIPENVGNAVYWLIFLIFLPGVLEALSLRGLLLPVQDMIGTLIGFLPSIFGGALILLVGWLAAKIVQRIASNLLATTGIDRAGEHVGLGGESQTISALVGTAIYTLILVLSAISALDTLQFKTVSAPATRMLTLVMNAVPSVLLAAAILIVSYYVGRFIRGLLTNVLAGAGLDNLLPRLGLDSGSFGGRSLSQIVGYLSQLGTMLFAAVEAAEALGLGEVSHILAQLIGFSGNVILGTIIFGTGLFLANLVASLLQERGPQGSVVSLAARVGIIVLTTAMALQQMGIANEIINTAFGLLLGAIAVAIALSFGLGTREIAARELENWLSRLRYNQS